MLSLFKGLNASLGTIDEASILVMPPPPIQGVGNDAGFTMQVQLRDGSFDMAKLQSITNAIVDNAKSQSAIQLVLASFRANVPQFDDRGRSGEDADARRVPRPGVRCALARHEARTRAGHRRPGREPLLEPVVGVRLGVERVDLDVARAAVHRGDRFGEAAIRLEPHPAAPAFAGLLFERVEQFGADALEQQARERGCTLRLPRSRACCSERVGRKLLDALATAGRATRQWQGRLPRSRACCSSASSSLRPTPRPRAAGANCSTRSNSRPANAGAAPCGSRVRGPAVRARRAQTARRALSSRPERGSRRVRLPRSRACCSSASSSLRPPHAVSASGANCSTRSYSRPANAGAAPCGSRVRGPAVRARRAVCARHRDRVRRARPTCA